MKDEYIIINRTAIQQRIEELRQVCNKELGYASDKIYFELEHLLSQSTPLIPEIEKAMTEIAKISSPFGKQGLAVWEKEFQQEYITNLKLDI